jgi:hypothetical protein
MLKFLVAMLLVAAASGFGAAPVPRSLAARRVAASTVSMKSINLKTKVVRAAMAAKGRHRLCIFKCARQQPCATSRRWSSVWEHRGARILRAQPPCDLRRAARAPRSRL